MVGKTPQVREIVFNILDDNGERTVVAKGATSVDVGDTKQLFTRTSNLEVLSSNNFSNISNVQSNIISIEGFMSQFSGSVYSPLLIQLQSHHTDNVTRIDTLFTDLSANAVNVDGTFSNVIVLQDDLSTNVTRIDTLFTDLSANAVNVDGTFSNVSILQVKQIADFANISSLQTDIEAVTEFGDITGLQANVVDLRNRVTTSGVRIGAGAGAFAQNSALSIGQQSGNFAGNNSIGLGGLANYNNTSEERGQREDCIVINATGATLSAPRSGTLVIGPIKEDNSNIICMMGANVLSSTTGACEITRTSLLKLMDSNVHISTNVSIANDTILFRPNGNGSFGGDIDINATLEVGGTSSFGGAMTLNDNLETTGTSSFGGKMEVNNDIDCNGESFIMKNGSAQKIILRDDGTADFVSDVDVGGKLDVVNTSSFGGAMTLNNNLETTGTSSFGGDMTINGNVTHTGESFIMNNGTNDKISLTHNGTSSFSGLMTVNNINCDNYVDIEHPTAGGLRIYNDNTGSEKASILQDGTGSFYSNVYINAVVDNTSTNPALKVAGRTLLDGGLSVSSTESSSFAGLVRFDGTSSFGDDMTLNNIVTQTGESFIMQGPDTNGTTGDRISLTHNGTSSFSGLMTVNNINCDTYVDIINSATGGLRIGTGTSSNFIQNATVLQDGTSSFAGAMELKNELTIDGHTYWKHNGSDRCKLTVGSGIADSEMLIRGNLKINNGSDTNASISAFGTGVLIQLNCGGFIHPHGPGNAFNFEGEIQADDFAITSDERLKSDIKKIPKALDKVKELSGYTYTINEKQSAGVIAQELLKVLPESVTTRDDGYYSVTYHGLIGLLIEAVKELSEKVK
jgi:hypothetical protein